MKQDKVILFVILIIALFSLNQRFCWGQNWRQKRSSHFIAYYDPDSTNTAYVTRLLRRAEKYYTDITRYLGLRRRNFWTWDNRCEIYIYPDKQTYNKKTTLPSWSAAHVSIKSKKISTFVKKTRFLDYILPHELGHIIFREFIGFNQDIPLWLDEGVATLQEKNRNKYITLAKKFTANNKHIKLKSLSNIGNYHNLNPQIFYSQAASLVEFLITHFPRHRFLALCRKIRDKNQWQESLLKIYNFRDFREMEQDWINWLQKQ